MILHNLLDSTPKCSMDRTRTRTTIMCPTSASSSFLSLMLKEKGIAPINAEIVQDNAKPKQAPNSTIRRSKSAVDQPCKWSRVASDKVLGPVVLQPRRQQQGNSSSILYSYGPPSGIPLRRGANDISLPLMPKRSPSPSRLRTRAQQTPTSNVSKNASWDNVDLSQMSKKAASKEAVLSVLLNASSTKTSGSVRGRHPSFSAYKVADAIGSPTSFIMPRKTFVVGPSSSKKLLDRWGNSSSTSRLANILLQPSSSSSSMGSPLRQKSSKFSSRK
jgi:hypothetical protein